MASRTTKPFYKAFNIRHEEEYDWYRDNGYYDRYKNIVGFEYMLASTFRYEGKDFGYPIGCWPIKDIYKLPRMMGFTHLDFATFQTDFDELKALGKLKIVEIDSTNYYTLKILEPLLSDFNKGVKFQTKEIDVS